MASWHPQPNHHVLTLRHGISILAVATTALVLAACQSAPAPHQAATFADSIGVNTHERNFNTPYGDWNKVQYFLGAAGIKHIRNDVLPPECGWCWPGLQQRLHDGLVSAQNNGISILVGRGCPSDTNTYGTLPQWFDELARLDRSKLDGVEGINEPNGFCGDSPDTIKQYDRELYYTSVERGFRPVTTPSPIDSGAYIAPVPADVGAVHPYTGNKLETTSNTQFAKDYTRAMCGDCPTWVTEIGPSAPNTAGGWPVISENQAAIIDVETFLQHFKDGIDKTYIYELVDGTGDANFGLIRGDWSPRPAYTAVKNLIHLAGTGRPALTTPNIQVSANDVQLLTLQQGPQDYVVAVWRDHVAPGEDVGVQLQAGATVGLADPISDYDFHTLGQTDGHATGFHLGDDPLLLHVHTG